MDEQSYHSSYQPPPDFRDRKEPWDKFIAFLKKWKVQLLLIIFGVGGGVWLSVNVMEGVPTLDQLENPRPELSTRIISADGEPIDQFYIKNRTTVKLREVPKAMITALIATEDRNFFDHWGIDVWRTAKAAWIDVITLRSEERRVGKEVSSSKLPDH